MSKSQIILVSSLTLLVSACASVMPTTNEGDISSAPPTVVTPEIPQVSNTESCNKLNMLIADHSNNFKQVRGSRLNTRITEIMQIWTADRVFPLAKKCQVWAWSAGLSSYVCGWSEDNEAQAKLSYAAGVGNIEQCLGEQWQSQAVNSQSGGGGVLYSQTGNKTVVSIRYFKESRSILENWKMLLYVGDKQNMEGAAR